MNRRLLFAVALIATFLASFLIIGGSLRQTHNTPPPKPPPADTSTATPTPTPSHRPGVISWDACPTHPGPSCPTAPIACPTGIDTGRYFYRQCPLPKGLRK